jgi:hypothetical protein
MTREIIGKLDIGFYPDTHRVVMIFRNSPFADADGNVNVDYSAESARELARRLIMAADMVDGRIPEPRASVPPRQPGRSGPAADADDPANYAGPARGDR